ncbi:Carbonic anhydrase [uncultured Candidatus Thioglobus sp.]|nr:Carbonic anhydrase [uncultured Candidatus Thioglobus sp.]
MSHQCNHNSDIHQLFENNKKWASEMTQSNPDFFSNLAMQQTPEYLWIGCSDSRVPANELVKMDPGTIFVHRNVANLVNADDANILAVIQYAIEVLKVKHIIINGHYGCGGVQAAMNTNNPDLIDCWIHPIRKYYQRSEHKLAQLPKETQIDQLCEINVIEQVHNICRLPIINKAWEAGQAIAVHGFIYDIKDGQLHNLDVSVNSAEEAEALKR